MVVVMVRDSGWVIVRDSGEGARGCDDSERQW